MSSMYSKLSHFVLMVLFLSKVENFEMKSVHFQSKLFYWIPRNPNTTDLYSKSVMKCVLLCVLNDLCLTASYSVETYTCRLDLSGKRFFIIEPMNGWTVVKRNGQPTMSVNGCIDHGPSMYIIVDKAANWTTAKENCKSLGGQLAEIETYEENDFMKNEVRTRDTRVFGYWLGAYNFNQDSDMEWISSPVKVMPFTDMWTGEPNNPSASFCMAIWQVYDYQWGDYHCGTTISYICEF